MMRSALVCRCMAVLALANVTGTAHSRSTLIDGEEPDMYEDTYTFVCPDGGYESGCTRRDVERAVVLGDAPQDMLAFDCLYRTQADCTVTASGQITPQTLDSVLHWQLLALQSDDGPATEMIVLFEQDGALANLFLSHQTEGYFDPPVAEQDGEGRFLLHVPARNGGLGNADLFLMESGTGWNWWTGDQLLQDINRMLPPGLALASPVNFNFREGSAFALVRREEDAGCRATGGVANIDFDFSRPNEINIAAVSLQYTNAAEFR